MPNRAFIDTLFVIALINRRDHYHQQALDLAAQFEGDPLLVTDAVLLEIGNALARSYKQEAVAIIEQFLTAAEVEVVHLTPRLFAQGVAPQLTVQLVRQAAQTLRKQGHIVQEDSAQYMHEAAHQSLQYNGTIFYVD